MIVPRGSESTATAGCWRSRLADPAGSGLLVVGDDGVAHQHCDRDRAYSAGNRRHPACDFLDAVRIDVQCFEAFRQLGKKIASNPEEELRRVQRDLDEAGVPHEVRQLVRGNEPVADFMLDQLERWGVYPMLRTAELFRQEFSQLGLSHLTHETHGAVMFYCGDT